MKSIFSNITILILVTIFLMIFSIYIDWGNSSWMWFQRSGSILALSGAILSYRSIVRLGKTGVGGANPTFVKAKLVSINDDGSATISYDEETSKMFRQADIDRLAGYIGAYMMIVGTVIWGYGDLVGTALLSLNRL